MDPNRFDELTKALSTARSRRNLLQTLGAGLVGAVAAATRVLPAAADRKCKYGGANCAHDFNCCSGNCCNHLCCDAPPANGIGTCQNGLCGFACLSGFTTCNGACVAECTGGLVLDPTTCTCGCPSGTTACGGACVTNCSGGLVLDPNTCTCGCPSGTTACGGTCVDLLSDTANCGACGIACGSGTVCSHGNCCTSASGGACACSPTGFACDSQTCCQMSPFTCTSSGTCP